MRQTTISKRNDSYKKKWYIIDAKGQTLGRLSTTIAILLQGKHKPSYTPNLDFGDSIIVINSSYVKITGNLKEKKYYNVSGHPGGLRVRNVETMIEKYPEELVKKVVWGMMPKGKLGRKQHKNLYVYKGEQHNHDAQKPEIYVLNKGKDKNGKDNIT